MLTLTSGCSHLSQLLGLWAISGESQRGCWEQVGGRARLRICGTSYEGIWLFEPGGRGQNWEAETWEPLIQGVGGT